MPRKPRKGEFVCTCSAYAFPHRMFGGRCDGLEFVRTFWETTYGTGAREGCHACYQEEYCRGCEVVDGREDPQECPQLQEFIETNEIKAR